MNVETKVRMLEESERGREGKLVSKVKWIMNYHRSMVFGFGCWWEAETWVWGGRAIVKRRRSKTPP